MQQQRSQDIYRAFYTHSEPITRYMTEQLDARPGMRVLEPCAGDGAFVQALLEQCSGLGIDAWELNPETAAALAGHYAGRPDVWVCCGDALLCPELDASAASGGTYDRIVANPPYGGWQSHEKRSLLKHRYAGHYVRETYTLFLLRCVRLLREGGRLVMILPDTFLSLHRHTKLRQVLWRETQVEQVVLFPSRFFPRVGFGYANLAIITLRRRSDRAACLRHRLRVVTGFRQVDELPQAGSEAHHREFHFLQGELTQNADEALFVCDQEAVAAVINSRSPRIGDVADCVTGFYSGADRLYLRAGAGENGRGGRYAPVDEQRICGGGPVPPDGLDGERCFIPMVKGGSGRYLKGNRWYLDWGQEAVAHYRRDKRARFQNAAYYFHEGLAVPMVSSARISAALLEGRIFDQSIVGIFPHEAELLYYLLAFFNSPTANTLIRTINPSVNNSANYLKKLPFIRPGPAMLAEVSAGVAAILAQKRETGACDAALEKRLHTGISELYGF